VNGETHVYLTLSGDPELESPQVAATDLQAAASDIRPPPPTTRAEQGRRLIDIVEEWGLQSFPASDPPANW
jgi:hypothetical protein